ncbi:MAG: NTP transferase domain-containing protein [Gammaproteobacteria bacterium]|jgi:dTDP-glucose pyrophosphorylase|nr:NTP transferase domain-containing protein [Gammaproteobacteria bacterium]MBT4462016.1 NTP transferase domain-containing protein [Gammaproteobacteria bacterium]MBT4654528.1 NTP transferase domain-containing protein [Gammaproteobacteria bacterium]MBT5117140.1 NTP transferase domain-containing protein [Gammaproteobacteria bacterium]MBT5761469.1 NTP transferase domain-containing protein [Gammaproteobacteria bacterium]
MEISIKNNLLLKDSLITDAIKHLEKCDIKIIVIVDSDKKILGTITDGDIRRALLKEISLDSKCALIMNSNPHYSKINEIDKINRIIQVSKKSVVIVDNENKVIGIESSIKPHLNMRNQVIVMAGGKGTRLEPLTLDTPKPLLMIKEKPILHRIIDSLVSYGLIDIYISVLYKADHIVNYFNNGEGFNARIDYLKESKPLGTAGCLKLFKKYMNNEPIIVINGDVLTSINYDRLLDFHKKSKKSITICSAKYEIPLEYGTLNIKDGDLISLEEKPVKEYFVNAGIYIINPSVITNLEEKERFDMTDLLEIYIKTKSVAVFPMHEQWIDIGNHKDYKKANEE